MKAHLRYRQNNNHLEEEAGGQQEQLQRAELQSRNTSSYNISVAIFGATNQSQS